MEQKSLIIYSTHKYNKLSIIVDLNAQWLMLYLIGIMII